MPSHTCFAAAQKPENILMRASGHIAVTDFDLSKQAHPVGPRIIQQQMKLSDKIRKSLSLSKTRSSASSLVNLDIVNSEPVLPYQTNSFVGYVCCGLCLSWNIRRPCVRVLPL